MEYLLNQWYAAAWSHELTQALMVRTLLDEPVLLYRTQHGEPVALSDRCPHRFAPLHEGKLIDDIVQCPYHGLQFDKTGACVKNPIGNGAIPAKARARVFPLVERNGIVWAWFGDTPPDLARVVDFGFLDEPDRYAYAEGYMQLDANYALVSDNLLDLSHAEFLHPNLANPGANQRVKLSVEQEGNTVHAFNQRPGEPPTVLIRNAFSGKPPGDTLDMWSNTTWNPPSSICVEVGGTRLGGAKEEGVNTLAAHLITPISKNRSHYFWKMARTFRRDEAEFGEKFQSMVQSAFFTEDKPIIEAQQRYMQLPDGRQPESVLLQSDGAAVRARRVMASLMEQNVRGG